MVMITLVDDFFTRGCGRCERFDTPDCSTRPWADGLQELRRICLDAGLDETVKWGHPCYVASDRNVAIIGAFRADFRLTFFDAALLRDPEGVLERQGPNSQHASLIRFTDNAQPLAMAPVVRQYLDEAAGYAVAGIRPTRQPGELTLPDELIAALDVDPELADAFHSLTPGRQKSYVINLNSAKKPETRISRIAGFRPKILAGKGALER